MKTIKSEGGDKKREREIEKPDWGYVVEEGRGKGVHGHIQRAKLASDKGVYPGKTIYENELSTVLNSTW